jgi:hypothetical protein
LTADLQAFFRTEFMKTIKQKADNEAVRIESYLYTSRADGSRHLWAELDHEEAARAESRQVLRKADLSKLLLYNPSLL